MAPATQGCRGPILFLLAAAADAGVMSRLKVINGCDREPLWMAHEAGPGIGPDSQNVMVPPGGSFEFATPTGLSATRYWPKMGCDADGNHCTLGGSGGPGEACVRRPPEVQNDDYSRCAPPIDTKFEGTFGNPTLPCDDVLGVLGCDYVDMSLVDGWTLPFQLVIRGNCTSQKGKRDFLDIDCRGLTFDECPSAEMLHLTHADGSRGVSNVDLRAVNPNTGQVAGCYHPCQKLVSPNWENDLSSGRSPQAPEVAPYCCPTPPESPEACRNGPITKTQFLQVVHERCRGVYGYAYDDGMGLLRCSPHSQYELTFFCPGAPTTAKEGWAQRTASGAPAPSAPSSSPEQAPQDENKVLPSGLGPAAGLLGRTAAKPGAGAATTDNTLQNKSGSPKAPEPEEKEDAAADVEAREPTTSPGDRLIMARLPDGNRFRFGRLHPLSHPLGLTGQLLVAGEDGRFFALWLVTMVGIAAAGLVVIALTIGQLPRRPDAQAGRLVQTALLEEDGSPLSAGRSEIRSLL